MRSTKYACRTLAEAFEIIAKSRFATRSYNDKRVDESIIKRVVELAQLAPSSFNIQPYKFIVVVSDDARTALSSAMIGRGNITNVLKAPVTFVVLADRGNNREN